jgi:isoquinoline 1-oxidoreductase subunit beta
MSTTELDRRAILKLVGSAGCLALGFRAGPADAAATSQTASAAFEPNAWLRLFADGGIEVVISKTEMGQGTETGLAMIVADELDADWARVRVRTMRPDGKRFMITGGSYSISASWEPARQAAAAVRELLRGTGAQALGVPLAACRTESSTVLHPDSGRRVPYASLLEAAARLPLPK